MNRPDPDDRETDLEMQQFLERIGGAILIAGFAIGVLALLHAIGLGITQ